MLFINFNIYLTLFYKITLMPDFPFLIFCRKSGGSLAKPVHTGINLRGREHILTLQTICFCGRSSFLMGPHIISTVHALQALLAVCSVLFCSRRNAEW